MTKILLILRMNVATVLPLFTTLFFQASAQKTPSFKWFNPTESPYPVIKGKIWQNSVGTNWYNRLPEDSEKLIRPEVWNLAKNTAGEYIDFFTNADKVVVEYQTSGAKALDNMPALGVSGVDLYGQDTNGHWHWMRAVYRFADTTRFSYEHFDKKVTIKRYRIYLPLYSSVKWMKIGVGSDFHFEAEAAEEDSPMVFYGTSIMQGASASRAGMAWLNILGRRLNRPVINLGFSGNGRLEQPIIALMSKTNAKLFVLDCQPNLHDKKVFSADEISKRISDAVRTLRQTHPETPVLLVEHSSGLPSINLDADLTERYIWTSMILRETYQQLKKTGTKNLYLLRAEKIGFTDASTIDGTHPNDLGMLQYADAYEKIILDISKTSKNKRGRTSTSSN